MNYQSSSYLMNGVPGIPLGTDWGRINFALAGYGHLLAGTLSEIAPVVANSLASETCQAASSIIKTCNSTSYIEVI